MFDPETQLLENLVAIHLNKEFGDELYFYKKKVEVDFFIPKSGIAIQVPMFYQTMVADQQLLEVFIL